MTITKVETVEEEGAVTKWETKWEIEWGFLLGAFIFGFAFALVFLTIALGEYFVPGFWG